MKITLKTTHYNLEVLPEELSGTTLEQLLEAVRGGWLIGNDTIGMIVRECRVDALARQQKPRRE